MEGVAKAFYSGLVPLGRDAHEELLRQVARRRFPGDALPYLYWAFDKKQQLPRMGPEETRGFELMLRIWRETGMMPDYARVFDVPTSLHVEDTLMDLARHMGAWGKQTLLPAVRKAYGAALKSQVGKVQQATDGRVPRGMEIVFLAKTFPTLLISHSRLFDGGILLRSALRAMGQ